MSVLAASSRGSQGPDPVPTGDSPAADRAVPWNRLAPVLAPTVVALLAIFAAIPIVGNGPIRTVLDNAHWTISYSAAATLAWIAAQRGGPSRASARRWYAIGLSGYALGQVCWDVQVATGHNPFPAPSDALYLLLGACITIGLARDMRAIVRDAERRTLVLDAGVVAISLLTVVLALYLPLRGSNTALQMTVLIAYPLGMLTAACLALLVLPALRLRASAGWWIFAAALSFNGWLWLEWNALTLSGQLADGTFYNACFSITALALGVGVARWTPEATRDHALERRFEALMRLLPLVAVVCASLALIAVYARPDVPPVVRTTVLWGVAAVLLLAMARQSLLVHERDRTLELERQFHTLFDSAPEAILLMDAGRIVECNHSAERLFGLPSQCIVGRDPWHLSPPAQGGGESSETAAKQHIAAALEGRPQRFRWTHLRAGHGSFEAEVALHRVDLPGRTLMQGVVRDISDQLATEDARSRLQEQLRQASRMEAVGRLAGGVAHDFNNILTVILGTSELALMRLDDSHPLHGDLVEIRHSARRAAGLTSQLLAFSRKQPVSAKPVDLNALTRESLGMLERLMPEDVELAFEPCGDLPMVLLDRTQFEQVLVNLAVNARDAQPGGGCITISTGMTELGDPAARSRPGAGAGRYVTLTIADEGEGIPAEHVEHVFEPFFTTKELGRGTGLGLSTVYGIVQQSGGFIELDTEVGAGTRFVVHFPAAKAEPAVPQPAVPGASGVIGGSETLLLVEDEPGVRELTRRTLLDLGYQVVEAASGEAALEIAGRPGFQFDLLVTDVIMGGMSGREVHDRLAAMLPGLRSLFVSGYAGDELDARGVRERRVELLPKPFTRAQLAAAVRRALDRTAHDRPGNPGGEGSREAA